MYEETILIREKPVLRKSDQRLTGTGVRTRALTSSYVTTGADQSGLCDTLVFWGSGLGEDAFDVFHRTTGVFFRKRIAWGMWPRIFCESAAFGVTRMATFLSILWVGPKCPLHFYPNTRLDHEQLFSPLSHDKFQAIALVLTNSLSTQTDQSPKRLKNQKARLSDGVVFYTIYTRKDLNFSEGYFQDSKDSVHSTTAQGWCVW